MDHFRNNVKKKELRENFEGTLKDTYFVDFLEELVE